MSNPSPSPLRDKVYLETPYVLVHWQSDGPWVFVEWKAWANSTEYRAAHEAILGAIRDHRASRLLIDARQAKVISEDDQRWLTTDWIPRAVAAGRRWTAVVMPSSALVRTIVENIDKRPAQGTPEVRYFDTVEAAGVWLSEVR
jgi:hypothetical protein